MWATFLFYYEPDFRDSPCPCFKRLYTWNVSYSDLLRKLVFEEISSVQFSGSVVSDSLQHHESQHARPSCPSPTPGVYSNPCPSSQWCHPAISSSVIPFSSCPQSLPPSGSFPMSQLFAWGGQSIGVSASASVLPKNTQDWSPLGSTLERFKVMWEFQEDSNYIRLHTNRQEKKCRKNECQRNSSDATGG